MKKGILLISSAVALAATFAFAGGPDLIPVAPTPSINPFYFTFGSGYSFSMRANVVAPAPDWDSTPEGYNSYLRDSVFYSAGFGYRFSPLISVDIQGTIRPSYKYQKFQTSPALIGNKTRFFNFSNTSVMASAMLHGQGVSNHLVWGAPDFNVQPIIGAGLGVAYNRISNFHAILTTPIFDSQVVSIENPTTTTSFAWQAMAGLEATICHHASIDVGYRYFNGGRFKASNYVYQVAAPSGFTSILVPRWKGRFKANEVFVNFNYSFMS